MTAAMRLRYGLEAAAFFFFMALFRAIGLEAASGLGGWIGRNLFSHLPPDRIARANLVLAFPEKTPAERDAIRRRMWDNLGRVVAEYPHLEKFSASGSDPRIRYSVPVPGWIEEHRERALIYVSAHLGNWEMMPALCEQLGLNGATVVRPPNNPYVARWIARRRAANGPAELIAKHQAFRRMLARLKSGRSLYMLVDQKLREGIAVPFFGHPALTTPAPAALALRTGAPIVIASIRRTEGARFHATLHGELNVTPRGDEAADIQALTAAITARMEEIIRADPGQWLWIHNRWKDGR